MIDAAPEAILDALADLESVPSWSPLHKRIEVLDKYDDGRPHHVKVQYRIMGITDKELLEYHWGRDWMVWDRQTKGPAEYLGYPVVELPEDKAREIADVLTKRYVAEGVTAAARWPR